jgi:deazaflavin-dependent oxidoreductase (nitroreductase family)
MSSPDPRAAFAEMSRALIDDLRAHDGVVTTGPFLGRSVLLLTTIGARTRRPRLAPLVYSRDRDRLVIVASKGGAPAHPAWYANLVANPVVTVEAGGETFRARATVVEGEERERLYDAHAAVHPSFHDYRERTSRVIPVVVLERTDEG